MKDFTAPERTFGQLAPQAAARLAAASADIALVLDDRGVIQDMAFGSDQLSQDLGGHAAWPGLAWIGTVADDSRRKIESLIREAAGDAPTRWRHVNHLHPRGGSIPVLYSTLRLGPDRILAFGRDLQPLTTVQQRLVEAQQSMERDYARLRHAEARYRLLFQLCGEPVLVLDPSTLRIAEANAAGSRLFASNGRGAVGRSLGDILAPDSQAAMQSMLATIRAGGRAEEMRVRLLRPEGTEAVISASPFREDKSQMVLLRIALSPGEGAATAGAAGRRHLTRLAEAATDGFVVTGADGRILVANAAFLEMAQVAAEEQARGEPLERWLGRPGVDLEVLLANLRTRGPVRLFPTTLHGEHGARTEVEVSAVAVQAEGGQGFGFAIRDVGPRPIGRQPETRAMPRSVEQLTELVGRVPLKELVREATDVIERLAIEAALNLTNDNRASAAEMLGLSRQSLYVKLRRYGLGDLGGEEES